MDETEKRKTLTIRIEDEQWEEMKRRMPNEGSHTMQQFCATAIRYYLGYLSATDNEDFVTRTVDRAIQGRLAQFEDRHRRADSKVAIAMTEVLLIMMLAHEFTPQELRRIRARAVELVQKTGGPISAERAQIEAEQLVDDPFTGGDLE